MPIRDISSDYGVTTAPFVVKDLQAVQNKVMNLFRCPMGTRFRQPEFGCRLHEFVHEPCDGSTAYDILHDLLRAVARWIPEIEVKLDASMVVPLPSADGFYVKMSYYVPLLQQQGVLTFSAMR